MSDRFRNGCHLIFIQGIRNEILERTLAKINYPIIMNEGGAISKVWREIITDVFNVPTVLVKNRVGAPYGDCLLAARAIGHIKDYSTASEKAEYIEPLEPQKKHNELYMEYFELYKSIYRDIKDRFIDLNKLKEKHY